MKISDHILDQAQRSQALNTQASFIVQAPAGSGKTELLIQRFLALLSKVSQPEEIIAITFTRKAAHEMRQRIVHALSLAIHPEIAKKSLRESTLKLAQQALIQDKVHQWNLLEQPNRLKIQTIDAFCMHITQQMPILSRFGSVSSRITENPNEYYLQAVRQFLNELHPHQTWYGACVTLLLHLDNHVSRLEKLLVNMLAIRDQWLGHVVSSKQDQNLRTHLEKALKHAAENIQQQVLDTIPETLKDELLQIFKYAMMHLPQSNSAWQQLSSWPTQATMSHQPLWITLANILLTTNLQWRKQVNIKMGFPSPTSASNSRDKSLYRIMKQRMLSLLEQLQSHDAFRLALIEVLYCPPTHYSEGQWHILKALLALLPILCAQLKLTFAEHGVTDYIEISESALYALGNEEVLTDLALHLDYKIQHILVDEFQDTSISQFRLLQRLTAGWQQGDQRSLFLVGDPMQSIYRFRKAEVNLFLQAKAQGVGPIKLNFLRLETNFRASSSLVAWLNNVFQRVFPGQNNPTTGAIQYSFARALHANEKEPPQSAHYYLSTQKQNEVEQIVQIVQQCQTKDPNKSIAILVRARNQLPAILVKLNEANLLYQGVDIKNLSNSTIVQDLWALTRALLHPADRIAWLSILRAPWCGLNLKELHAIASLDAQASLLDLINDALTSANLSSNTRQRLQYFTQVVEASLSQRLRQPLRLWIETTWHKLGGYDCLRSEQDLQDAQAFFDLLEQNEKAGELPSTQNFQHQLEQLFMPVIANEKINLHIMTIHKAKGLEFDIVILPGLEKSTPQKKDALLTLSEKTNVNQETEFIFSPIKAYDEPSDPISYYLNRENNIKALHESERLFYVAATRAKHQLHLLATLGEKKDESTGKLAFKIPTKQSLLGHIWPYLKSVFTQSYTLQIANQTNPLHTQTLHYRLGNDWFKERSSTLAPPPKPDLARAHKQLDWQNDYKRQTGILIHKLFKFIALSGTGKWSKDSMASQKAKWESYLFQCGISGEKLQRSITLCEKALLNIQSDPKAAWILNPNHCDAQAEFALSTLNEGIKNNIVIDRTFIDEANIRWIIDYKTTENLGEDKAIFKQRAKADHLQQLKIYANRMQSIEHRPIKLGLYYPLIPLWIDCGYYEDKD